MEYRAYEVTVTFAAPAWDERDGIRYRVTARDKSQANRYARRRAYDDGHTVGRRAYFTARELPAGGCVDD
jgi:hypothetical protein